LRRVLGPFLEYGARYDNKNENQGQVEIGIRIGDRQDKKGGSQGRQKRREPGPSFEVVRWEPDSIIIIGAMLKQDRSWG